MGSVPIIREIAPNEMGLIKPLFLKVFKNDISDEMLTWKYACGRGKSYGAFIPEDGKLLAHCGIFYRNVLADGQACRIAQLGDLMAIPGKYGGLSRASSPFALLIKQVLDGLPCKTNPDGLAFGFPSDRAMRLGKHLGLFSSIDSMYELSFTPLPPSIRADRCDTLDPGNACFTDIANKLWQQMTDRLGRNLIGIRNAEYLMQRYLEHPLKQYDCHLISSRWLGRPIGILITRQERDQCEILDIIADIFQMERVLSTARRQMTIWGASNMKLWLTRLHAESFKGIAQAFNQLEFRIMANPFSSEGRPERFSNRWWLTSGDTDYH